MSNYHMKQGGGREGGVMSYLPHLTSAGLPGPDIDIVAGLAWPGVAGRGQIRPGYLHIPASSEVMRQLVIIRGSRATSRYGELEEQQSY